MANRTVYVDQDKCIACELCVSNLPEVFQMNDDGKAEVHNSQGASEADIQSEAIDVCPADYIHWQD